jgi:hypothetical protein
MASSTIPSVTAAGTSPAGLIASDIVEQLFPELPLAERAALGDILDRDLTAGGGRRRLRSLITNANIAYALTTVPYQAITVDSETMESQRRTCDDTSHYA